MATLIYRIASKTFGIRLTCNNENGFILGITLLFMAVLTILGSSAAVMTRAEIKVGGNYKNSEMAFLLHREERNTRGRCSGG